MSEAGCEELEHKLETFVETVRQIGIIVHDFQPNSQTVLNRKLEEVVKGNRVNLFFYSFFFAKYFETDKFSSSSVISLLIRLEQSLNNWLFQSVVDFLHYFLRGVTVISRASVSVYVDEC